MFKGIIGSIFILISAVLYSTKILSAAFVSIKNPVWGKEEFMQALTYTPDFLNLFIYLSFGLGVLGILLYVNEKRQNK